MKAKWRMPVAQIAHRQLFRWALLVLAVVIAALMGAVAKLLIPENVALTTGDSAVGNIVGVLALDTLVVATFLLSTKSVSCAAARSNTTLGRLGYLPHRETAARQAKPALKFVARNKTLKNDQRMLQGIASCSSNR